MKFKVFTVVLLPLFLSGCIQDSKNITIEKVGSKTYLIDQKSKEAFIINKDRLIQLKKSNPITLKIGEVLKEKYKISKSRIEVDASIKFFESKALYILKVSPVTINKTSDTGVVIKNRDNFDWYEKAIKDRDSYSYITLVLTDNDGFTLHEQKIKIARGYVRMVGSGDEVSSYIYEGTISINAESSKYIDKISFVYSI